MPAPLIYGFPAGQYTEMVLQGRCFFATNPSVQLFSVNTTAATGLIATNPAGSGVNMVILQLLVALASAPAGQSNLIWTGTLLTTASAATTHTTPLTTKNCFIGSSFTAASCLIDSAATVPTPAAIRAIPGGPVAAASVVSPYIEQKVGGIMILAPGCVISVQAMTTAISAVATIVWREDPQ